MANIHIEGSSKMSRGEFLAALAAAPINADKIVVVHNRCTGSLLREWAAHKLLWQLHIFRSHTESVDLDWPQPWYFRLGYFVVGGVALLFYK